MLTPKMEFAYIKKTCMTIITESRQIPLFSSWLDTRNTFDTDFTKCAHINFTGKLVF